MCLAAGCTCFLQLQPLLNNALILYSVLKMTKNILLRPRLFSLRRKQVFLHEGWDRFVLQTLLNCSVHSLVIEDGGGVLGGLGELSDGMGTVMKSS